MAGGPEEVAWPLHESLLLSPRQDVFRVDCDGGAGVLV